MTFKKAFNDTFAESLKENGFQYNKKYGMHVRFVNDELLQYVTYEKYSSTSRGNYSYRILSGVLSIYTYAVLTKDLLMWGLDLYSISKEYGYEKSATNICYTYNDETMMEVIRLSLEETKRIIIPIFDKVFDLNSYIEYKRRTRLDAIIGAENFELYKNDALVLIQADNHDDFQIFLQEKLEQIKRMIEAKQIGGTYEEQYYLLNRSIIKLGAESRDKVYADPELYARAKKELERRKEANLEILRKNGVI